MPAGSNISAIMPPRFQRFLFSKRLLLPLLVGMLATASAETVPSNLVIEGIPPIPAELKTRVARYLNLGGSSFRGWNTKERQMVVTTREGNTIQLDSVAEPMAKRAKFTKWSEMVNYGWYQPGAGKYFIFQSDKGGDEQFQYYVIDVTQPGSAPVLLTDGKSRNTGLRWSHHGLLVAWASNQRNGKDNDIYVANPARPGSARLLTTSDSPDWGVADWNRNATKVLLRHGVTTSKSEIWTVDVKSGTRTQVTKKDDKVFLNHLRFAEKDSAIYGMGYEKSDFLLLVRLDVQTGEHEALTEHIPWDVEDFEISPDGATVAFVTNEDGFSRLHLLDVATRKEKPVPKIPGELLTDLAWRDSSRELGFTLSNSQSPKDAWSLDVDTQELTRWTDRTRKTTVQEAFAEPEIIHVKAADGVSISSLLYRPDPQKFRGQRPVIISIHGGPAGQSRPGFRGTSNYYLNQEGVALVYPNVRGSEGYGLKFAKLDNGFGREAAVADIGAVIDWIKKDPSLDPKRIAVMGGSYGGFMTLACLVKYHDVLRCGVDSVGIANFLTFLRDTSDYRRENRRSEYGDERKPEMHDFLEKISPANHASEIRAPLMIVQGKNDPRVPVTEAEQMRDAIRAHGGTVWYLMATDEGHGFHKKPNADYEFWATVLFLRENLLK